MEDSNNPRPSDPKDIRSVTLGDIEQRDGNKPEPILSFYEHVARIVPPVRLYPTLAEAMAPTMGEPGPNMARNVRVNPVDISNLFSSYAQRHNFDPDDQILEEFNKYNEVVDMYQRRNEGGIPSHTTIDLVREANHTAILITSDISEGMQLIQYLDPAYKRDKSGSYLSRDQLRAKGLFIMDKGSGLVVDLTSLIDPSIRALLSTKQRYSESFAEEDFRLGEGILNRGLSYGIISNLHDLGGLFHEVGHHIYSGAFPLTVGEHRLAFEYRTSPRNLSDQDYLRARKIVLDNELAASFAAVVIMRQIATTHTLSEREKAEFGMAFVQGYNSYLDNAELRVPLEPEGLHGRGTNIYFSGLMLREEKPEDSLNLIERTAQ